MAGRGEQSERFAWPILKNEITLLFQLYLEERYHLTVSKTAFLFALAKSKNWAKTSNIISSFDYFIILLKKDIKKIVT